MLHLGSSRCQCINPLTPKRDQFQISPAASPLIKNLAFIAKSDKSLLYYQLPLPHLVGRTYFLNLGVKGLCSAAVYGRQPIPLRLLFADESTLTEVTWSSLNGTLKTTKVESAVIPRPPGSHPAQNGPSRDVPTFFMTFTGFGLNENNLKDWLRGCCKQVCRAYCNFRPARKLLWPLSSSVRPSPTVCFVLMSAFSLSLP